MIATRLLSSVYLVLIIFSSVIAQDNSENTEWVKRINELSVVVADNPDSVLQLATEHLDGCVFAGDKKLGYYYSFMAEYYYYKQDLSQSLRAYQSSLSAFLNTDDSSRLSVLYNNIGLIHYHKANYDSALIAYNHSLEREKIEGDKEGIAQSYQNLGIIYGKWGRYDLVDEYYNNALRLFEELNDYSSVAAVTNNLAVMAVRQEAYEKGFGYYKKAYEAYRQLGEQDGMASVSANLGRLFGIWNQQARANEYFNRALDIFTRLDDKIGLVHTYSMIGEMHVDHDRIDDALKMYAKASEINATVGLREVQIDNLTDLYAAYKQLGEYKRANEMLEKSSALKDSIYDQQQLEKIIELEKKYHAEKSEKELALVKASAERNRLFMWGVSILFLLLTIIVLIWVKVLKIKERQRRTSMEHKVLRAQMNPHFIFNSLSALQCIILENNQEDAVDFVADFSGLMRLVLQYAKEERITLKKEKEILDTYMSLQNRRFDNKINYSIEFDEQIELNTVMVPPMLTQPFLENAIEHGQLTQEDSYIHVNLKRNNDKLEFSIEDNGIGIKNSMLLNKGKVKKHESVAMGLTKERLDLLNNNEHNKAVTMKIEDLSKYGKHGTRVVFNVPYMTLN